MADKLDIRFKSNIISPFRTNGSDTIKGLFTDWYRYKKRLIFVNGPRNTSKTAHILTLIFLLHSKCPGLQTCIVRTEAATIKTSIVPTLNNKLLAYQFGDKRNPFRLHGGTNQPQHIDFDNGGRCVLGGFGVTKESGKVLGAEYSVAFYNQVERETNPENISNLRACMSGGRGGDALSINGIPHNLFIVDANPDSPKHFLYQQRDAFLYYDFKHHDHPLYRDDETGQLNARGIALREELYEDYPEGYMRDRMVDGIWCGAAGRVYPKFTLSNVKEVRRGDIGVDWEWYSGLDYGHIEPNVYNAWAFNPERTKGIHYKQIYKTELLTNTFADMIQALERNHQVSPIVRVSDHDKQLNADLASMGVETQNADKDILSGIDLYRRKIASMDIIFNNEDNILDHLPDANLRRKGKCLNGIDEILEYVHKDEKDQKGDGKDDYPAPNQDDHSMDTDRYIFKAAFPSLPIPTLNIKSVSIPHHYVN